MNKEAKGGRKRASYGSLPVGTEKFTFCDKFKSYLDGDPDDAPDHPLAKS